MFKPLLSLFPDHISFLPTSTFSPHETAAHLAHSTAPPRWPASHPSAGKLFLLSSFMASPSPLALAAAVRLPFTLSQSQVASSTHTLLTGEEVVARSSCY